MPYAVLPPNRQPVWSHTTINARSKPAPLLTSRHALCFPATISTCLISLCVFSGFEVWSLSLVCMDQPCLLQSRLKWCIYPSTCFGRSVEGAVAFFPRLTGHALKVVSNKQGSCFSSPALRPRTWYLSLIPLQLCNYLLPFHHSIHLTARTAEKSPSSPQTRHGNLNSNHDATNQKYRGLLQTCYGPIRRSVSLQKQPSNTRLESLHWQCYLT